MVVDIVIRERLGAKYLVKLEKPKFDLNLSGNTGKYELKRYIWETRMVKAVGGYQLLY